MAYEIREGQGSMWPPKKRTSDKAPNLSGTCRINGQLYRIAAWQKTSNDGTNWLSLKVEPAEDRGPREDMAPF